MSDRASLDERIRDVAERLWDVIKDDPSGIVAFTGSGISSESGIPVFRGNEGLWEGFRAEELATPEAFRANPGRVWDWYHWRRRLVLDAQPNPAHQALVALEAEGLLSQIVTQNVDGLHQRAGSRHVIELHGNIHRARCIQCGRRGELDASATGVMRCAHCNGSPARPDIVWFGEMLPEEAWNASYASVVRCKAMLAIGTSGLVYPAAGLCEVAVSPHRASGPALLVIINPEETGLDGLADFHLRGRAGEVLPKLAEHLLALKDQREGIA